MPRRNALVVACVAALSVAGVVVPAHGAPLRCESRTVPVHVGSAAWTIGGTYCASRQTPDAVFVLVPGATYNRAYWDFPYQPKTYSFARAMAKRGYASFVIDRLGTGDSSKPPSAVVNTSVQVEALHQLIESVRAGGFETVIVGGHSLGSMIALVQAARYHDVDGLLVTGLTHKPVGEALLHLVADHAHPAPMDPAFAGTVDPGYLTSKPGTRYSAFHAPGQVDPQVVAVDEATKDVVALGEPGEGFVWTSSLAPSSSQVSVPVLVAQGGDDPYFCGPEAGGSDCSDESALLAEERPQYAGAPCVDAVVMPGVGHDVNLHPSAPAYQDRVADWADALLAGDCPAGR
jgi:pimeloyl-ACP methyl ester carboxylesterase